MKYIIKSIAVMLIMLFSISASAGSENQHATSEKITIDKPLYKPFIERYILDELKTLRQEQQNLRVELAEKVANSKLDISDRALRYTADTTANIFYIITIAVSIIVILGWKSLRDIKETVESTTSLRISKLILKYEDRLDEMEKQAQLRSDQIAANQEELANTNQLHSLWLRAGLEKSEQEKINIYDEILELNPDDIDALTYKADTLLDIHEDKWALSLSNQALKIDDQYALAYWQRACARVKLKQFDEAVDDIKYAIGLTESLRDEIKGEIYFEPLKGNAEFEFLVAGIESYEGY